MRPPSDRLLAYATIALQLSTLCTMLWIGDMLRYQSSLTQTLIAQDRAMSTTYIDESGFSHTVETPYMPGGGTAAQHRIDLISSFCVFPPRDPPAWFNPAEDCPR